MFHIDFWPWGLMLGLLVWSLLGFGGWTFVRGGSVNKIEGVDE